MKTVQDFIEIYASTLPLRRSELDSLTFTGDRTADPAELQDWFLRNGLSPQAGLPMNRIGIYTDFT